MANFSELKIRLQNEGYDGIRGNLIRIFKISEHPDLKNASLDFQEIDDEFGYVNLGMAYGVQSQINGLHYFWDGIQITQSQIDQSGFFNENGEPLDVNDLYREAQLVSERFKQGLNDQFGLNLEWYDTYPLPMIDLRQGGYGCSCYAYEQSSGTMYQNCQMAYST